MNYKFQAYINRLQTHDWYYDNSNDPSKWQIGFNERQTLYEYAEEFDRTYNHWNMYAPDEFQVRVK